MAEVHIDIDNGAALNLLLSALIDSLQEGVMLLSPQRKPVYLNSKARELCQQLEDSHYHSTSLPLVISELCYQLIKDSQAKNQLLVRECQGAEGQIIRLRAYCLNLQLPGDATAAFAACQFILLSFEDRHQTLQEELKIEQKKYDLTKREAQLWELLKQGATYQKIAQTLQISLNTVKFHLKNIYAKKRNFQGLKKAICFDHLANQG